MPPQAGALTRPRRKLHETYSRIRYASILEACKPKEMNDNLALDEPLLRVYNVGSI